MSHSYNEYLTAPKAMSFEECGRLHQEILKGIDNDKDALEIYDNLIEKATEYAALRSNWTTRDIVWTLNEDPRRTATHDTLISHINMLSRYLKHVGKSNNWREILGYEEDNSYNRKRIGDFGCYLAFVHALNGR